MSSSLIIFSIEGGSEHMLRGKRLLNLHFALLSEVNVRRRNGESCDSLPAKSCSHYMDTEVVRYECRSFEERSQFTPPHTIHRGISGLPIWFVHWNLISSYYSIFSESVISVCSVGRKMYIVYLLERSKMWCFTSIVSFLLCKKRLAFPKSPLNKLRSGIFVTGKERADRSLLDVQVYTVHLKYRIVHLHFSHLLRLPRFYIF